VPFTKNNPISVPNGPNDLEESITIRREGNDARIEIQSSNLTEPRSFLVSSLSSTAQEKSGFRAVLRAARIAAYLADGYTQT
jgi:hypothetical protein